MSFSTVPAFVHYGSWDDETRKHEAMTWMEKYTHAIDAKAWNTEPSGNWLTPDCTLQKSTGEVINGGDAAWATCAKELYGPFSSHLHIPQFCAVWENKDGWEMLGVATMHWNLAVPGEGGKFKGADGKEWDGAGPAAFDFHYRKTENGIRISKLSIYADPTAAVVGMLKRGMMKPEDLMK